jgi:lysine-N-methylase
MKYTVPDYYRKFKCIAADCPATCCAGWQIVIDEKSLEKYSEVKGPFGNRLANSIDWEEGTFEQYKKRCAFLNEENLCDIYTEAGPDLLCRTCRNYPRHIEVFDNEREISLSLSCPVVARMLLGRRTKTRFVEAQNEREEEGDEEFDFFLYSALQDCRALMIRILQKRSERIDTRMAMVLSLAHDVQNRIDARQIFAMEELLSRYDAEDSFTKFRKRLERFRKETYNKEEERPNIRAGIRAMHRKEALLELLEELEVLDETWPPQLASGRDILYGNGAQKYHMHRALCRELWMQQDEPWMDTEMEQLMVYFLFTYFCGAVYDGDALAKTKMAVASTLILRELEYARQIQKMGEDGDPEITLEERAQIAWRFSRELEHSDPNLNKMEKWMKESDAAQFETLMHCILD